jgi:hypothetical protein
VRALILVLSVAVVLLAASILLAEDPAPAEGPVFHAARLISDALPGEFARYRDEEGYLRTWRVTATAGGDGVPRKAILQHVEDPTGREIREAAVPYEHWPSRHGLFPVLAPEDPEGYDRLWVWTRIRRERVPGPDGRERDAWRVDLIDPALDPERDADHVVAWLDESIPVFGLLRWQRAGKTWVLEDWGPR